MQGLFYECYRCCKLSFYGPCVLSNLRKMLKILDVVRAPLSGNPQPWKLFVAGSDALDRLRQVHEVRFGKGCQIKEDLDTNGHSTGALR